MDKDEEDKRKCMLNAAINEDEEVVKEARTRRHAVLALDEDEEEKMKNLC